MSECARHRDALLEAVPYELSGAGETELARHIRECHPCRTLARRILDANAELDTALSAAGAAPDVDALLARARRPDPPSGDRAYRARRATRWIALAAAAVLAGVLLARGHDPSLPGTPYAPRPAQRPLVEAPGDRNVIVLPTRNPDITVLWFY